MRLDAVYELRDRLETAAIAGVNLIPEDFRLKRAVQQLEPYAKASPVFQKIYVMAQKLTAAECADRPGVLFDTLGLVDAVLCTQGTLQTEGTIQPLVPGNSQGELYRQIPYSRMAPVLEAFRGTGGGRYAVIRDARQTDPEIFEDYRMKYWMVQALGDSYADLADMAAGWLEEEGVSILPLLKKDFRPGGKKDMVRRLQVMEAVAKEKENDFYCFVLRNAGKEVREEAIRALRFEEGNLPLLLDLVKTEKGKCRDAVLYALAFMKGTEAQAFWKAQMEKKPEEAAGYLGYSETEWAGDLIADALERWFAQYGPGTKAAETPEHADKAKERRQDALDILTRSLVRNPHPALCRLAEEMYQKHGDECLEPVFTASLLTETAGQSLERFGGYLKPAGVISKLAGKKKNPDGLIRTFARIYYSEEHECYRITEDRADSPVIMEYRAWRRLPAGLDLGWYPLLMSCEADSSREWKKRWSRYGSYYDEILAGLYRPGVQTLAQQYGAYFYKEVLRRPATAEDIRMLKRCGWTNYKGILAACQRGGTVQIYMIRQLLPELPMTGSELADELDELLGRLKGKAVNGIGFLEQWRDSLRSGLTADRL